SVVYKGFKEYLSTNYITSEEILDVLCKVIERSANIRNSEIVFDGFTGFTPIQYKLLQLLLLNCRDIQVSVTIDADEKLNVAEGMHNIFFMSKDMAGKLMRMCDASHVEVKPHVILGKDKNWRFSDREDLAYLEKNVFRPGRKSYDKTPQNIRMYAAASRKEEINYCIGEIIRLTGVEGYHYRDIAIVSGDIASYGKQVANVCQHNNIPVFVDHKKSVTDNPAVELIRSVLEVVEKNYSYDSMFRYLKTGLAGVDTEDVDLLDNYCVAVGVRNGKAWKEAFYKKGRGRNSYPLDRLNELRRIIIEPIVKLEEVLRSKKSTVRQCVVALYEYVVSMGLEEKIEKLAMHPDTGNEYEQLYKKIIGLFDSMVELLGAERVSLREFNRIVDSGFEEIKVGLIPPTADCIMVGDIERTRLDDVKVLFFVGVNDGVVPKKNENKSVLSETDRDTLYGMDVTLSPTVREKAFVQRFYLYLMLTKMSDKLYISYAGRSSDGKSLLPSYLIRTIRQMFPLIKVESCESAAKVHKYIRIPKSEIEWNNNNCINILSENVAMEVFGNELFGSVSAFETFASCKFAYFLRYGLGIEEREEYGFAYNDFGTILHSVLEQISSELKNEKRSISGLTDEERGTLVSRCIGKISETYGDTILKDSSRNEFLIQRMTQLADRTLWTIGRQLESGAFVPDAYEMSFIIDEQEIPLKDRKGTLTMKGKIDRIDVYEDAENVYVRVVDYKSGKSDFDLVKTYYGLKMQLIMYMRAAMQIEAKRHPDKKIIPAGILYYNIDNPLIEVAGEDGADVEDKIYETLRMQGIVNGDGFIARNMDLNAVKKSPVVPVTFNKDGGLDAGKSHTISTGQFATLNDYIGKKASCIGADIMSGRIDVNPYEEGVRSSCDYCPYGAVCGFSPDLTGEGYRRIKKFNDEIIWQNMKEGVDENGRKMD
ncbi:MAG: PD-(D/E)XK nuclease family protein, partial [Lachnospira sp.]|nr:PD-(D/E)XK nuclease family protein [Lachnospira sp.]